MKHLMIEQKANITDGAAIAGGTIATYVTTNGLSLVVGFVTVLVLLSRLYINYLEIKERKRRLADAE